MTEEMKAFLQKYLERAERNAKDAWQDREEHIAAAKESLKTMEQHSAMARQLKEMIEAAK